MNSNNIYILGFIIFSFSCIITFSILSYISMPTLVQTKIKMNNF